MGSAQDSGDGNGFNSGTNSSDQSLPLGQPPGLQDVAGPSGPKEVVSLGDWSTARLLSTAARLWERELAEDLNATRLSPSSLTALQALAETGITNQAGLARRIHITAQSLGRTLRVLEGIGYVRKAPRTLGKRDNTISITAAGSRALTAFQGESPRGKGAVLSSVEPTSRIPTAALRKDLVKLLRHIAPRTGTN